MDIGVAVAGDWAIGDLEPLLHNDSDSEEDPVCCVCEVSSRSFRKVFWVSKASIDVNCQLLQ